MAFIRDIFKTGWSTSKPGDMKNPGHIAMKQLGASVTQAEIDDAKERKQAAFAKAMSTKIDMLGDITTTDDVRHERLAEVIESLRMLGVAESEIGRHISGGFGRAQLAAELAVEAKNQPNPDRPQTEVDAW